MAVLMLILTQLIAVVACLWLAYGCYLAGLSLLQLGRGAKPLLVILLAVFSAAVYVAGALVIDFFSHLHYD